MSVTIAGSPLKKMTHNGQTVKKWVHDGVTVLNSKLSLYNRGDTCASATGGWKTYSYPGSNAFTFNADHVYYGAGETSGVFVTAAPVDVTGYTSLKITCQLTSMNALAQFGLNASAPTNELDAYYGMLEYYVNVGTSASEVTFTLDVSKITGSFYVEYAFWKSVGRIYEIWLE